MTRRDFVRKIFKIAVTIAASPYIPLPKTAYGKLAQHASLLGIPYHQSNATTGTWLGITRSETSFWSSKPVGPGRPIDKEVIIAIKKLMETAMEDSQNELNKAYYK
jgi:hypothetical protein